jgi:hypothetical protein
MSDSQPAPSVHGVAPSFRNSRCVLLHAVLRVFTTVFFCFNLPGFRVLLSRFELALTALNIDLTRSRSGLGATPVASKAAIRALASSMSGCSLSSSAMVVERSRSYFFLPSLRREYVSACVSSSMGS